MGSVIKILDETISNIIAAGEVVENPESMIKELLENSFDAGAKNIVISVENSGRYVKITDNGSGMSKEDIFLSIERHATSKILNKEDIFNLKTYGFRGEALASIASVSKLSIASRTSLDEIGTVILSNSGNISKVFEKPMNIGTEIEVKDLFFNTPARLKFLRSKATEYGKIKDIVLKEALVNYNTSILLNFDNNEVLRTSGKGIENTLIEIFGKNILKNMLQFKYGFLGNSEISRGNRDYIFTYFNNRYAKSKIVETAVIDSYYTKLDKGKYPFVILFIDIDPTLIDVNVHPTKKVVKFSNDANIYSTIKNEILNFFDNNELEYLPKIENMQYKSEEHTLKDLSQGENYKIYEGERLFEKTDNIVARDANTLQNKTVYNNYEIIKKKYEKTENLENYTNNYNTEIQNEVSTKEDIAIKKENRNYKIYGQLNNMYILVEKNGDLEIYDQHIIHERILYEELKEKYYSKEIRVKPLLVPIVCVIDYKQKEILEKNINAFEEFGFYYNEFGENEIIIRKVPDFEFSEGVKSVFFELIDELSKGNDIKDIREKIIISMSCKGAIKAGEPLDINEMYKIIDKLHSIGKYTCPHGRPIIIKIEKDHLDKMFKRK
ncbi:MAG: DNA mismatch repair endonuclease MutL [Fusobacteria bacterium]|nr:DNA mismatch repair endonuclease MutL [Fusobacteriota bacterium]